MKLALQCVSVLFASGDSGVATSCSNGGPPGWIRASTPASPSSTPTARASRPASPPRAPTSLPWARVYSDSGCRALSIGGTSRQRAHLRRPRDAAERGAHRSRQGPAGGFLNPTLYAHPEALYDITIGSNPGCGTGGFNATPGWDPVTALGTPNFPKLQEVFLSLPREVRLIHSEFT